MSCGTHADPLRVLRAVRFASRYRFTMVDELKAAASLEEVCPSVAPCMYFSSAL